MSSIGTGYDLDVSEYSPEGKIFQVEYAAKAVEASGTALGFCCRDGVVLAVENIVTSKLYESNCNRRVFHVDRHIGMAASGLLPDARAVMRHARDEAAEYRQSHGEPIPLRELVHRVSNLMHAYTLYSAARPFGCGVLLAAHENGQSLLYGIEPSGVFYRYHGYAIGKAKQNARTEIEKLKLADLTAADGVKEAAKIVHSCHDEIKDKYFELDLSWVGANTADRHVIVTGQQWAEASDFAKAALEDRDSDDD